MARKHEKDEEKRRMKVGKGRREGKEVMAAKMREMRQNQQKGRMTERELARDVDII